MNRFLGALCAVLAVLLVAACTSAPGASVGRSRRWLPQPRRPARRSSRPCPTRPHVQTAAALAQALRDVEDALCG